jgi:hypothetical protein
MGCLALGPGAVSPFWIFISAPGAVSPSADPMSFIELIT